MSVVETTSPTMRILTLSLMRILMLRHSGLYRSSQMTIKERQRRCCANLPLVLQNKKFNLFPAL